MKNAHVRRSINLSLRMFVLFLLLAQIFLPVAITAESSTPSPVVSSTITPGTTVEPSGEPSVSPSVPPETSPTAEPSPLEEATPTPPDPTPSDPAPTEPSVETLMVESFVSGLSVSNGKPYMFKELEANDTIFIDRAYQFTSDVNPLLGSHFLQTANDDKLSSGDNWVSFTVDRPVYVVVAHDTRIKKKPSWLEDYIKTGFKIKVFNADSELYVKKFDAGSVVLGGNKRSGDTDKGTSMYNVFVVDAATVPPIPMPTPSVVKGPAAEDFGPSFPMCTPGQTVASFGTYTLANDFDSLPDTVKLKMNIPSSFNGMNGTLKVLQGEGHNWDRGFDPVNGPKSSLSSGLHSYAKQFQSDEIVKFYWGSHESSLSFIGKFVDHSPNRGNAATDMDNVTTEYSFPMGELHTGEHVLKMVHNQEKDGPQSVFVKGVVCAAEAVTPTPTATMTPTPTPTDTPTPTLTMTPTPTPSEPSVPACVPGPGYAASVVSSAQGLQKNLLPVPLSRSNPLSALGAINGTFFSLGMNGTITVAFAEPVVDLPGTDFVSYETTFFRQTYMDELATVEVSEDGVTWYTLPEIAGNRAPLSPFGATSFDFSSTGLDMVQYVRLTDASDFGSSAFLDADSYDLDGILGLMVTCEE